MDARNRPIDNSTWNDLVYVFKKIQDPSESGDTIIGVIPKEEEHDTPPNNVSEFLSLDNGKLEIFIDSLREHNCFVFLDKKRHITSTHRICDGTNKIFIFEDNVSSTEPDGRSYFDGVENYINFIDFIKQKEIANCVTTEIIYLHEGLQGLRFPLLEELSPTQLLHNFHSQEKLMEKLTEEHDKHKLEKIAIFRQMLVDILIKVPETERPAELIKKSKLLFELFDERYRIYLSGFSVNKILQDAKKDHSDFCKQLQSLVLDTGNKLLIIPAGYILLGTAKKEIISLLPTWVILTGAFLFALSLSITLCIQYMNISTLSKLLESYKKEKIEIIKSEQKELEMLFNPMIKKLSLLKLLTIIFIVISVFLFFVAIIIFVPTIFNYVLENIIKIYRILPIQF